MPVLVRTIALVLGGVSERDRERAGERESEEQTRNERETRQRGNEQQDKQAVTEH